MTQREFLNTIVEGAVVTAEMADMATEMLDRLNKRNETRANTTKAKNDEINAPIMKAIVEYLEGKTNALAGEIAKAVDTSTQKVTALCKKLAENGEIVVSDVKVKGKGKVKGYTLA